MLQILFFGESFMLDIGCYAHAQLQWGISLHVIVNIIKCKRMHLLCVHESELHVKCITHTCKRNRIERLNVDTKYHAHSM